jgi:S1-C subfamily serine protease
MTGNGADCAPDFAEKGHGVRFFASGRHAGNPLQHFEDGPVVVKNPAKGALGTGFTNFAVARNRLYIAFRTVEVECAGREDRRLRLFGLGVRLAQVGSGRPNQQVLGGELISTLMSEPHTSEAKSAEPGRSDAPVSQESNEVCDSWQQMVQVVLGVVLLLGAVAMFHYYAPRAAEGAPPSDLQQQVHQLTAQVEELKQEQAMPARVLNRYRNSIGYIYGVYQVGFANQRPSIRARVSGTGFLVADGLLATNRHVAEPWYGDSEAESLIHRGARPALESLVVFFPGSPMPVKLSPAGVSSNSDLAVLRTENSAALRALAVLPLAKSATAPGERVTVIGYPMGIAGMVAKSPSGIYQRLAYRHNDITAASELAALSLIRPSATCGHLGDVVGDKLIYDAPTAHGGSGGPVFNAQGEVIGINSAYMDGFSGGTLGISVEALRPLMEAVQKQ